MTPERYQQMGQLFDEALERASEGRAAWLAQACDADVELRAEVEKLLANLVTSEAFLSRPALDVAAELYAQNPPALAEASAVENQISHYQILSLLGAGGMGQVYLAEKTRDWGDRWRSSCCRRGLCRMRNTCAALSEKRCRPLL